MNKDRTIGIVLFILGILIVILTRQIPDFRISEDIGPRLFPYISGFGLIICGIPLIFRKSTRNSKQYMTAEGWKRLFIISGVIILYALGTVLFGFRIATPIAVFMSILVMDENKKSYIKALVISIVITGLVFIIFEKILKVMLPAGKFF